MGNVIPTVGERAQDVQVILQTEFPEYLHDSQIGKGKFMKAHVVKRMLREAGKGAATAAGDDGSGGAGGGGGGGGGSGVGGVGVLLPGYGLGDRVVVKMYVKRSDKSPDVGKRMQIARQQLTQLCGAFNLAAQPNIVPYQRFEDSLRNDAAFLIRQHFMFNMVDRLNTRPFVSGLEKLWFIYQLLRAVQQAHAAGVRHGDIKCENVMVTTWGWLLLTDFATFKPTFIPEDHPADFYYFFESGTRRRCYIAPERFVRERDLERISGSAGWFAGMPGAALVTPGGTGSGSSGAGDAGALALPAPSARDRGKVAIAAPPTMLHPAGTPAAAASAAAAAAAAAGAGSGSGSGAAPRPSIVAAAAAAVAGSGVGDGLPTAPSHAGVGGGVGSGVGSGSGGAGGSSAPVIMVWPCDPVLTEAMDNFALGCTLAEIALDGEPLLELSGLLTYRASNGAVSPLDAPGAAEALHAMDESGQLRRMIGQLVTHSPAARATPVAVLQAMTTPLPAEYSAAPAALPSQLLFPSYFPYLCNLFASVLQPELQHGTHRVLLLAATYGDCVRSVTRGCIDPAGLKLMRHRLRLEPDTPLKAHAIAVGASLAGAFPAPPIPPLPATGDPRRPRRQRFPLHGSVVAAHLASAGESGDAPPMPYSVAGQRAQEAAEEVRWEYGWLDGGASGGAYAVEASAEDGEDWDLEWASHWDDFPPAAAATLRAAYRGSMLTVHEPWVGMRWVGATAAPETTGRPHAGSAVSAGGQHPPPPPPPTHNRTSFASTASGGGSSVATSAVVGPLNTASPPPPPPPPPSSAASTALTTFGHPQSALVFPNEPTQAASALTGLAQGVAEAVGSAHQAGDKGEHAAAPAVPTPHPPLWEEVDGHDIDGRGFALLLCLLTSSLRHIDTPRTKLTALLLMSRYAAYADDEARMQRVVPFVMTALSDPSPIVRANALCCLTAVLQRVREFSPSDGMLFPQIVFPALQRAAKDASEPVVQVAAAECLPRLSEVAKRFVDITQYTAQLAQIGHSLAHGKGGDDAPSAPNPSATPATPTAGEEDKEGDLRDTRVPSDLDVDAAGVTSPSLLTAGGRSLGATEEEVVAIQAATARMDAAARAALLTHLRVRSLGDHDLADVHERISATFQMWQQQLAVAGQTAAASATLDPTYASLAAAAGAFTGGASLDTVLAGHPPLLESEVLQQMVRALAQLHASNDSAVLRRHLVLHADVLASVFGRAGSEERLLPLLITFSSDPFLFTLVQAVGPHLLHALAPVLNTPVTEALTVDELRIAQQPTATPPLRQMLLTWLTRSTIGAGDWLARVAFVQQLGKLALVLGAYNTQATLLPLIDEEVSCPHHPVAYAALAALATIIAHRLVPVALARSYVTRYACLLVHPSAWLRTGALRLIATTWWVLGWPGALVMTADDVNPLLHGREGHTMWQRVQALLTAPATAHSGAGHNTVGALASALSQAALPHVTRRAFHQRLSQTALNALKVRSPPLTVRLKGVAVERERLLVASGRVQPRSDARRTGSGGRGSAAATGILTAGVRGGSAGSGGGGSGGVVRGSVSDMLVTGGAAVGGRRPSGRLPVAPAARGGGVRSRAPSGAWEGFGDGLDGGDADVYGLANEGGQSSDGEDADAFAPAFQVDGDGSSEEGQGESDDYVDVASEVDEYSPVPLGALVGTHGGRHPRRVGSAAAALRSLPSPAASPPAAPPSPYAIVAFAPPFASDVDRRAYTVLRLDTLITDRDRFGPFLVSSVLQARATHVGSHLPGRHPAAATRTVDEVRTAVQRVATARFVPALPYNADDLASLQLRTISVPDQRYANLHPQPPTAAVIRTPNPQDEAGAGATAGSAGHVVGRRLAGDGTAAVHAVDAHGVPTSIASWVARRGAGSVTEYLCHPAPATKASLPQWLHPAVTSPPLPADAFSYMVAIAARAAPVEVPTAALERRLGWSAALPLSGVVSRPLTMPLPPTVVEHAQSSALTPSHAPTLLPSFRRQGSADSSASHFASPGPQSTSRHPSFSHAAATRSVGRQVSAATTVGSGAAAAYGEPTLGRRAASLAEGSIGPTGGAADRASGGLIADGALVAGTLAVTPVRHLALLRSTFRRAGRMARRAHLQHGIWDMQLQTEAGGSGAGAGSGGGGGAAQATAFFYSTVQQAGQPSIDATLASSDEEDRAAPRWSALRGTAAVAAGLEGSSRKGGPISATAADGAPRRPLSGAETARTGSGPLAGRSPTLGSRSAPPINALLSLDELASDAAAALTESAAEGDGEHADVRPAGMLDSTAHDDGDAASADELLFAGGGAAGAHAVSASASGMAGPLVIGPGEAAKDPRVTPAAAVARFSSTVHTAIMASDGSAFLARVMDLAREAGLPVSSLPPVPTAAERNAAAAGGAAAFSTAYSLASASLRQDGARGRAGGAAHTAPFMFTVRQSAGGAGGEAGAAGAGGAGAAGVVMNGAGGVWRVAAATTTAEALDSQGFGGIPSAAISIVKRAAAAGGSDGPGSGGGATMRRAGGLAAGGGGVAPGRGTAAPRAGGTGGAAQDGAMVEVLYDAELRVQRANAFALPLIALGEPSTAAPGAAGGAASGSGPREGVTIIPQYTSQLSDGAGARGSRSVTRRAVDAPVDGDAASVTSSQPRRRARHGMDMRDYLSPEATLSLMRRLRALSVPPLPPHLGTLAKAGDVATTIIAHAVRVALGLAAPDSLSSISGGVGGGGMAVSLSSALRPGVVLALDEAPAPGDCLDPVEAWVCGGADPATLPQAPLTVRAALAIRASGRFPGGVLGGAVGPSPGLVGGGGDAGAIPGAIVDGFEVVGGPVGVAEHGRAAPTMFGVRSMATLTSSASMSGDATSITGGTGTGTGSGDGVSGPMGPMAVALPLPIPLTEDIARPPDVGDGSGYAGSGPTSFLGVERGWRDGVGVGPPVGSAYGSLLVTGGTTGGLGVGGGGGGGGGTPIGSGCGGSGAFVGTDGTRLGAAAEMGGGGVASSGDGSATTGVDGTWCSRPRGLLLATAAEHTGPVTAMSVCQDHSFFCTSSADGTVRVWATRGLDRDVAVASALTYTGHLQESRHGDVARGMVPGDISVNDAVVCENSTSIATASSAGTVHVFRVDVPGLRKSSGVGGSIAPAVAISEYIAAAGTLAGDATAARRNTHGSFVRGSSLAGGHRRSTLADGDGGSEGVGAGSEAGDLDYPQQAASVGKTSVAGCDGVALVRRLVFDASEGQAVAVRNYHTATQHVLAVAMEQGVVHGCDLRARSEAWVCKLPAALGRITAMELVPGGAAVMVGTDRGVVAVHDLRFGMLICAWRHSARVPIHAVHPYVTVAPRQGQASPAAPLFTLGGAATDDNAPVMPVARHLAAALVTGDNEVSFWNLETGTCTRLLRGLPTTVHPADAYRLPFLTRIRVVGGRITPAAASAAGLPHTPPLAAAVGEMSRVMPPFTRTRALLCPLPTSVIPFTAGMFGDSISDASSRAYADAILASTDGGGGDGGSGAPATNSSSSSSAAAAGIGFVLGGLRGAGAARRRDKPFAVGYAVGAGPAVGAAGGGGGGGGGGSVSPTYAASAAPGGGMDATTVGFVYGGTAHEGLPVWMLTAGDDATVRCWDLDRPRASHTVCGLSPGVPRDAYEGAWVRPHPPHVWHVAGGGGMDSGGGGDRSAASPGPASGKGHGGDEGHDDAAAEDSGDDGEAVDEGLMPDVPDHTGLRQPAHFVAYTRDDGLCGDAVVDVDLSTAGGGGRRGGRRRMRQYVYHHQHGTPARVIFSQPLYDPAAEGDTMGVGGVPSSPAIALRGPTPAPTSHASSITALAWLDLPTRLLLTGGADGVVKVWR